MKQKTGNGIMNGIKLVTNTESHFGFIFNNEGQAVRIFLVKLWLQ